MSKAVRRLALAAILTPLVAGSAMAQGTQAQREACMSDAFALCASDIPDEGRIAGCLRREQAHVSQPCLRELNAAAPTRQASLKK